MFKSYRKTGFLIISFQRLRDLLKSMTRPPSPFDNSFLFFGDIELLTWSLTLVSGILDSSETKSGGKGISGDGYTPY